MQVVLRFGEEVATRSVVADLVWEGLEESLPAGGVTAAEERCKLTGPSAAVAVEGFDEDVEVAAMDGRGGGGDGHLMVQEMLD